MVNEEYSKHLDTPFRSWTTKYVGEAANVGEYGFLANEVFFCDDEYVGKLFSNKTLFLSGQCQRHVTSEK